MIRIKTAFVLRLTDDFSGKTITGKKFLFQRNGQTIKPVEKAEGLYVFLEPMEPVEQIEIISSDYYPRMAVIDRAQLEPGDPVEEIRLFGRPGGSFSYRYSLVYGQVEAKKDTFPAEICVKREKETGLSFKELKTEAGEQRLIVNGFTREILTGKTFAFIHKDKTEVFVITEKIGMNEYKIKGSIAGKYPAKAPIWRVYRSVTDETGNYAIPVEVGEEDSISEVMILRHI